MRSLASARGGFVALLTFSAACSDFFGTEPAPHDGGRAHSLAGRGGAGSTSRPDASSEAAGGRGGLFADANDGSPPPPDVSEGSAGAASDASEPADVPVEAANDADGGVDQISEEILAADADASTDTPIATDVADGPDAGLEAGGPILNYSTTHECDLLGLGSLAGSGRPNPVTRLAIAHNFPGITQDILDVVTLYDPATGANYFPTLEGAFAPPVGDKYLGTGAHVNYAPPVLGTELGYAIEQKLGGARSRLWVQFGTSYVPPLLARTTDAVGAEILNDDLLGWTVQSDSPHDPGAYAPDSGQYFPRRCVDMLFVSMAVPHSLHRFDASPAVFDATTLNGYARDGGYPLGAGLTPGPGFGVRTSAAEDDKLYLRFPDSKNYPKPRIVCATTAAGVSAGDATCRAAGTSGDYCVWEERLLPPQGICKFGPGAPSRCTDRSVCFTRLPPSLLGVPDGGLLPHFQRVRAGVDVKNQAVEDALRGRFSLVSFARDPANDAKVFVFGREQALGHSSYSMDPVLMRLTFDPASGGLGAPEYFAGTCGGRACREDAVDADWVPNGSAAAPLFAESKLFVGNTSVSYVAPLSGIGDRKPWVMLYGGRVPPARLSEIETVVAGPSLTGSEQSLPPEYAWDQTVGIYLRRAAHPWGPWTEPVTVFNPYRVQPQSGVNNAGYCSIMYLESGAGPESGATSCQSIYGGPAFDPLNNSLNRNHTGSGAEYGSELLGFYSEPLATGAAIYWLMSTFNPYRVILQRTELFF